MFDMLVILKVRLMKLNLPANEYQGFLNSIFNERKTWVSVFLSAELTLYFVPQLKMYFFNIGKMFQ